MLHGKLERGPEEVALREVVPSAPPSTFFCIKNTRSIYFILYNIMCNNYLFQRKQITYMFLLKEIKLRPLYRRKDIEEVEVSYQRVLYYCNHCDPRGFAVKQRYIIKQARLCSSALYVDSNLLIKVCSNIINIVWQIDTF